MDAKAGSFVPIVGALASELEDMAARNPKSNVPSVFQKGEVLEIKNSTFRVVSIGKNEMRLKLLPEFKDAKESPDA